jgi:hypothetical protein|tara:strand:+ start:180 stop:383 length:204 start_codon:yes stop_codon:yes gene_type:complete
MGTIWAHAMRKYGRFQGYAWGGVVVVGAAAYAASALGGGGGGRAGEKGNPREGAARAMQKNERRTRQ